MAGFPNQPNFHQYSNIPQQQYGQQPQQMQNQQYQWNMTPQNFQNYQYQQQTIPYQQQTHQQNMIYQQPQQQTYQQPYFLQEQQKQNTASVFQQDQQKARDQQNNHYGQNQTSQQPQTPQQPQQRQLYQPPERPKQQHQQNQQQRQYQQNQNQRRDNQPSSSNKPSYIKPSSPLNDFGDMGAAVRKYAEVDVNDSLQSSSSTKVDDDFPKVVDNHPYRKSHGLTVWDSYNKQGNIPGPFEKFEDFRGLAPAQLNAFYNAGFQAPTPIQAQSWPIALMNRDVVSIAKTGSGKTLAFLLPAYNKINQRHANKNQISALVLAPTRELATQIQEEADKFGSIAGFYSACAYGGAPKRDQLRAMNSGISVLVATPGRLNDYIESGQVNLSSVFYLVLDEADRMLDMGFEPQIRSIIKRLPKQRQTLMFSATWPEEVRRLAHDFLYQPIHIRLGGLEQGLRANESIKQNLILLRSGEDKDSELVNLIQSKYQRNRELVLIFVARKNTCDFVANMLNRVGIRAAAMHGDRDQTYREKTLAAFRDGSRPIMVATDVASRGIDVKGISAVVNYDLANSTEDYVHRIGRTGRAGMVGESFTFVTHSHEDMFKTMGIVEVMAKTNQHPPRQIQQMIDQLKQRQEQNKARNAAENEQFQKVLIVAEKPSVAKMIAEHLGNGRFRTRRGQSRANQIFECIKWFAPAQQKCKLMITSVVGHIFGLNFQGRTGKDPALLFDAKVEKTVEENTKKLRIVEHLQELGEEADFLFLWLDCDREGENIGFEVISLTQQWIHYDNVYRAKFSALTKQELIAAYDNPVRPDKYAAMSVDARQELDLKIGVAFSRLMTRTFLDNAREKFRLKDQKVISYGPCQTPTLWFCAERHREIQKFRPKKFYNVTVVANIQGQNIRLKWVEENINNPATIREMEDHVKSARMATITNIEEQEKKVARPLGLNTVTLLKACSKGLGMSPTAAMHAAEHLYTSGYISYPRTETTAYPPSFDLHGVLEEQVHHPNWGRTCDYLLRSGRVKTPDKGYDVGDHPPITPMRSATRDEFNKQNEWRIYDYVTRHFIGSLHDDLTYMERKIFVDVAGYQFHYTWHEVLDRGFVHAMPWKFKGLQLNESRMNTPQYNSSVPIRNFLKEEDETKPPDYLQESELIALMDKHGIGTDASIPQHIKNVQERHYVDVCGPGENGQKGQIIPQRKYFGKGHKGPQNHQERPTSRHMVPRGFGLAFLSCFEELDKELCEPSIRAYMEQQVCKIATGETEKNEVVSSNLKLFHEKFLFYRDNLERCSKFFAPKVYDADGNLVRKDSLPGMGQGNFQGRNQGERDGRQTGGERGGSGRGRGGFGAQGRGRGRGQGYGRGGSVYDTDRRDNYQNNDDFYGGRGGNSNSRGGNRGSNQGTRGNQSYRGNSRGRGNESRGGENNFNNSSRGRGGESNFNNSSRGRGGGGPRNDDFDGNRGRGGGYGRGRGAGYSGSDNRRGGFNNTYSRGTNNQTVGQKRGGNPMQPSNDTKKIHHSY